MNIQYMIQQLNIINTDNNIINNNISIILSNLCTNPSLALAQLKRLNKLLKEHNLKEIETEK